MDIWGLYFLVLMNNAIKNNQAQIFYMDLYLCVSGIAGSYGNCLNFWETEKLFTKMVAMYDGSNFPLILPVLVIIHIFYCYPSDCEEVSITILIFISLMANYVRYFFMYLLVISVSLERDLFKSLPIFKLCYLSLKCWVVIVLQKCSLYYCDFCLFLRILKKLIWPFCQYSHCLYGGADFQSFLFCWTKCASQVIFYRLNEFQFFGTFLNCRIVNRFCLNVNHVLIFFFKDNSLFQWTYDLDKGDVKIIWLKIQLSQHTIRKYWWVDGN